MSHYCFVFITILSIHSFLTIFGKACNFIKYLYILKNVIVICTYIHKKYRSICIDVILITSVDVYVQFDVAVAHCIKK